MEESKHYRLQYIKWVNQGDYVEYYTKLFCNEDPDVNVEFRERYSSLRKLHESLKKETNSINYPKFPDKKYFGNTEDKFLNRRFAELQSYFNTVLGSKDFSQLPTLKTWIKDLISTNSKIPPKETKKTEKILVNISGDNAIEKTVRNKSVKQNQGIIIIII